MFRNFKQRLDRWAIGMAAQALPVGNYDADRVRKSADLLSDKSFLKPIEAEAELIKDESGAFTFRSVVASGSPTNDLVHGRLFRAQGEWRSKPFVILLHGWNAELHYLYILPRVARAMNRRDLNVALMELPHHLHRRSPREQPGVHDFISDDLPVMLLAARQSITDIHALARWALRQGSSGVAVWGFSLGAWLAGLYATVAEVPSAAVLTTPIIDMAQAVRELSFCHPIRAGLADQVLDLSPLNLTSHRPRIPPDSIYVCQCDYDLFVPNATYDALRAAWNLPECVREPQSHLSVLLSRASMNATMDWLARELTTTPTVSPARPAPTV